MALSKEKIKEMGPRSIGTEMGRKIFTLVFLEEISQEEIREILLKDYIDNKNSMLDNHKIGKIIDKQSLSNLISNYIRAWLDMSYITVRRKRVKKLKSKSHPTANYYYGTLEPYFHYLSLNGVKLSIGMKKSLNFCMDTSYNSTAREDLIKEDMDFLEIMNSFLKEILILGIYSDLNGFVGKMFKKEFKIPETIYLICKLYDASSLLLLKEYLITRFREYKSKDKIFIKNQIKMLEKIDKVYDIKKGSYFYKTIHQNEKIKLF